MAKLKLKIQKRDLLGRKVKKIRHEGILPANIFGKNIKSLAVQFSQSEFWPIYHQAGETVLIELSLAGEKTPRPVLIHNIQLDPITNKPIHIDFHQVSLTEKVKAEIPIELIGESPAIEQKLGILVRLLDEIEIEALPTDLPEKIEVDISSLLKVDDMVKVGDLKLDKSKIKVLTDEANLVVKIEPLAKIEEEKPVEAEAPAEATTAVDEGQEPITETAGKSQKEVSKSEPTSKTRE